VLPLSIPAETIAKPGVEVWNESFATVRRLRIAIVVHGRFHGFDLARGLMALGHDVVVFTSLPKFIAGRFGLPAGAVRSLLLHGVLSRLLGKLTLAARAESGLHKLFSRLALKALLKEQQHRGDFDVVHIFSGVAEEVLRSGELRGLKTLLRGSAHISTQRELLAQEAVRLGCAVELPSDWMIARELREYALADRIVVMSQFAKRSFMDQGIAQSKLLVAPAGAELADFAPAELIINQRLERIASGQKLVVLLVGTLSAQKGIVDLEKIVNALGKTLQFIFVGTTAADAATTVARLPELTCLPRVAQHELHEHYAKADLFLHPTIQDGFAVVIIQALMSGLPVLCTSHCAASDVIADGEQGFVLPIRSAEAFIDRLAMLDQNRDLLTKLVRNVAQSQKQFGWDKAAQQFVDQHCLALL
jgi:glycosyltransferase involved in cell wall biosynthesis